MAIRDRVQSLLATAAAALPFRKPEAPLQRIEPVAVADPRDGRAPTVDEMTSEIARPRIGSVRNTVSVGAVRNLDPRRLAHMLRAAEDGDPDAYLSLAEEMEERDLHYLSVLGQRKRQVAQLPMTLGAASDEPLDEKIAKDVQENIIDKGLLDVVASDALDAVGKGFSLLEIIWDTRPDCWRIDRLEWVNPRLVRHDRETMREPKLLGDAGQLEDLSQFKFVYLELKAKSGLPIRGGLARAVAWAYMFKTFTLTSWVQFCEVYGIPWRIGSYDQGATDKDMDALLRAVCSLASDAAAIKPKQMDIEIKESGATTASSALFKDHAVYYDDQISKAVLGQTRTVDAAAGGLNNGDAGTHVREDIERADAKALELAFNRFVIQPYVIVNYGPQARYPYLTIARPEQKNVAQMVDAAVKLVPLGLKVRAADLREAVGFGEPQDNDELLIAPALPSPFNFGGFGIGGTTPERAQQAIAAARVHAELLAQELGGGPDAIATASKRMAMESAEMLSPVVDQIIAAAAASTDEEGFRRRLRALRDDLDMTPLADSLTSLCFQSLAGGMFGETLRR